MIFHVFNCPYPMLLPVWTASVFCLLITLFQQNQIKSTWEQGQGFTILLNRYKFAKICPWKWKKGLKKFCDTDEDCGWIKDNLLSGQSYAMIKEDTYGYKKQTYYKNRQVCYNVNRKVQWKMVLTILFKRQSVGTTNIINQIYELHCTEHYEYVTCI
jgi:hypothetical protein